MYLKCLQKGKRNVTLKLAYSIQANEIHGTNEGKCFHDCHLEKIIDVDVNDAIKTEFTLMDINVSYFLYYLASKLTISNR